MPVNRRKPEWRKITPFAGIDTKYGFESRTATGDQATLGQVPINPTQDAENLVIYPNNCKPSVATKTTTGGSSSGLIDRDKIASARTAGWRIKIGRPPSQRRPKGSNQHIKVDMGTVNYALIRPQDALSNLLASFGHGTPDANDRLWYGCLFPFPPTAAVKNAAGQSASSKCKPANLDTVIQAGGYLIHPGRYTAEHLANLIGAGAAGGGGAP